MRQQSNFGAAVIIDSRGMVVEKQAFFQAVSSYLSIVARFNMSGPDDD
jgi:hypothetical protein